MPIDPQNLFAIRDKAAIITGAAGGIGTVLVAACWFRLFPSLAQRDRLAKTHDA